MGITCHQEWREGHLKPGAGWVPEGGSQRRELWVEAQGSREPGKGQEEDQAGWGCPELCPVPRSTG